MPSRDMQAQELGAALPMRADVCSWGGGPSPCWTGTVMGASREEGEQRN